MIERSSNENFRLLDVSSEEQSDLELHIIPSRKKKITRRERSKGTITKGADINVETELRCAVRWAVRGTVLLWLLMLTWLCAALYDQVSSLRLDISKVSTSSNSVGDALQLCHTAAKELRANASSLSVRVARLEAERAGLARRVNDTAAALADVSARLEAAPSLADMPRRLKDLQRTIADIGSQISGFDGALSSAKKLAASAAAGVEQVRASLRTVAERTDEAAANVSRVASGGGELARQLRAWNETLLRTMGDMQARLDGLMKLASTPAPPPPPPPPPAPSTPPPALAPSTAAPAPPAPPATPAPPAAQGPAIKPIILGGAQ